MEEHRILLVDDEIDLCTVVREYLHSKGFSVDYFESAEDAWDSVVKEPYALLIFDWDLPGASGIDLCVHYRNLGGVAPVLMMTGRKELDDKELGLESGADDYVTKPFALRELHARIKSMLRRSNTYSPKLVDGVVEAKTGLVIAGKYCLDEPIGKGGMAMVWRATDIVMGRPVVIKLMHGKLVHDDETSRRFEHEWRMIAKIKHPNVVTIHDAGCLNEQIPYLVMEHIQGATLRNLLEEHGRLSFSNTINIMGQICNGLQEAHNAGIVHRDLKPENILIQDQTDRQDAVKIVDFGIARMLDSTSRLTQEGIVVGTIDYISPEQLNDQPPDGRSDIYSLGIMLFEMLTGTMPFVAETVDGLVAKHLISFPDLPSSRREDIEEGSGFDQIVSKCLQKTPDLRFENPNELKSALDLLR